MGVDLAGSGGSILRISGPPWLRNATSPMWRSIRLRLHHSLRLPRSCISHLYIPGPSSNVPSTQSEGVTATPAVLQAPRLSDFQHFFNSTKSIIFRSAPGNQWPSSLGFVNARLHDPTSSLLVQARAGPERWIVLFQNFSRH